MQVADEVEPDDLPTDEEVHQFLEDNPEWMERLLQEFKARLPALLKEIGSRHRDSGDPDPQP